MPSTHECGIAILPKVLLIWSNGDPFTEREADDRAVVVKRDRDARGRGGHHCSCWSSKTPMEKVALWWSSEMPVTK